MSEAKRSFSIVITNYNYGRFLGAAIDSALNQNVAADEVIGRRFAVYQKVPPGITGL